MRRYRAWLIAAALSAVWAAVVVLAGREFVAAELGHRYQYVLPIRADAPLWEAGLTPPFYEVFRSAAEEKLPALFNWFGYMGVDDWNLHAEKREWKEFEFPDGNVLYLDPAMTEADQAYVNEQFWAQRGARRAEWLEHMQPWIFMALAAPGLLFVFLAMRPFFRVLRAEA